MKLASQSLIGEHDFRNFCKMDVGNGVVEFKRRIMDVQIEIIGDGEADGYSMCRLKLIGQAFLWVLQHTTKNHEAKPKPLNISFLKYFNFYNSTKSDVLLLYFFLLGKETKNLRLFRKCWMSRKILGFGF